MDFSEVKNIFYNQVAVDYNCSLNEVISSKNIVTEFALNEGRRKFIHEDSIFSVISLGAKMIVKAKKEMRTWCEEVYLKKVGAEFIIDPLEFRILENELYKHGHMVCLMHIYFLPRKYPDIKEVGKVKWYEEEDIKQFKGDKRFGNAFVFEEGTKDILGISALDENDNVIAMASSTENSENMWEIGIDTVKDSRAKGRASNIVSMLVKEILNRGKVPFYGTAPSHIISQKVALNSFMTPFFCEIKTRKIKEKDRKYFQYP